MHTFLIMKKKLGSELLPTSHLIRVLWRSCQQCSTGRQELQRALAQHTALSLRMSAGQPWKGLKEILLYCIWSFIFPGRECWISCFPSILPVCLQPGLVWVGSCRWVGREVARRASHSRSIPSPAGMGLVATAVLEHFASPISELLAWTHPPQCLGNLSVGKTCDAFPQYAQKLS